jgi:2',3'-cyclic-nucleotide 2'-phosphodiesterase (5'-nucleotidase family)
MATLSLLCTTDWHGRLTPARARRLRALREERRALLLDCGDALTAPNILLWPWPEGVLRRMNEAGYDAMAAGNREFFFRRSGLLRKTRPANFPVLAANLRGRDGAPVLPPEIVLAAEGGRVGVFGLMREMIPAGSRLEAVSDLRFVPWQEAARAAVERLAPQADWLVALSHLGPQADEELARLCPELDLLLSGHGHPMASATRQIGTVTVITPAPHGREVVAVRGESDVPPGRRPFEVEVIAL